MNVLEWTGKVVSGEGQMLERIFFWTQSLALKRAIIILSPVSIVASEKLCPFTRCNSCILCTVLLFAHPGVTEAGAQLFCGYQTLRQMGMSSQTEFLGPSLTFFSLCGWNWQCKHLSGESTGKKEWHRGQGQGGRSCTPNTCSWLATLYSQVYSRFWPSLLPGFPDMTTCSFEQHCIWKEGNFDSDCWYWRK